MNTTNDNQQAEDLGIENPHDLVISFLADTRSSVESKKRASVQIQDECKKNWLDSDNSIHGHEALDSVLQTLKGLSGGFLTMMDKQTLAEAIKNYTIEEDRNLLRYKLHLNVDQKRLLLDELYRAKKNYNANYYFFYQNCASVLVKVIGVGVKSEKISAFSPLVSPPNSLVALFIREGLATPVRPAFFSYRKKAYLAQDLIRHKYQELIWQYPEVSWPAITGLFAAKQQKRLLFVKAIARNMHYARELDLHLNQLYILIQEAEMAFERKDLICDNYTSAVTAQTRRYQRAYLLKSALSTKSNSSTTDKLLEEYYLPRAEQAFAQGVPHTKLLAYGLAAGHYRSNEYESGITTVHFTLDEQEFGSISNVAMQRSSFVKLGSIQMNFVAESNPAIHLQAWHVTVLEVRKFKDRLNRVPSYFSSAGSMGLGLSLLDFEKDYTLGVKHGSWFGGELLFNLFSSVEHNNYVFTSIGVDFRHYNKLDKLLNGFALPIQLETLWTPDAKRRWQWRNQFEYRYAFESEFAAEVDISSALTYQIGEFAGRLVLARLSSEYKDYGFGDISQASWIGIEVNPY